MKKLIIIFLLFVFAHNTYANILSKNFIKCSLWRDKELLVVDIQKDGDDFYNVSTHNATSKTNKTKLLFHAPDSDTIKQLIILGVEFKVTFIELLDFGGVVTITVNVKTKEAWMSRHTGLFTHFTGKCDTDIF